jgi:hypothetical protein
VFKEGGMTEISELLLQQIAGDLERLLCEDRENINFAYGKQTGALKMGIGITFDQGTDGIVVEYAIAYDLEPKPVPPEKHKIKYKHVYTEGQMAMEFIGKEIREGRMAVAVNGETIGKTA